MDDIKKPITSESTRFLDMVRYFIRERNLAYTTENA